MFLLVFLHCNIAVLSSPSDVFNRLYFIDVDFKYFPFCLARRLQRVRLLPEQDRKSHGVLVQLAGLPDVRRITGENNHSTQVIINKRDCVTKMVNYQQVVPAHGGFGVRSAATRRRTRSRCIRNDVLILTLVRHYINRARIKMHALCETCNNATTMTADHGVCVRRDLRKRLFLIEHYSIESTLEKGRKRHF